MGVIYPNGYIREREVTLKHLLLGTYSLLDASFRFSLSNSDLSHDNSQNDNDDSNQDSAFFKSVLKSSRLLFMGVPVTVGSFFAMVILAGPSIGGQTGADELLKTSSLYFITAFITWAALQKRASSEAHLQNERTQNAEGQDTDRHTGDHRGELGTLVKNYYYYYHYYDDDRCVSYEHSHIMRETRV